MAIETDLNASPYFDDYDETKNFHKVLFKPGVSVQVRELNQMQAILQSQIERFGNNIFKRGTIIDGCNFNYNKNIKYVKILDNDIDNNPVSVNYLNQDFRIKNANNVVATIINVSDGFESTTPDLKTLYLVYINAGNSSNEYNFSSDQELTVYSKDYKLGSISINSGGISFSNSDSVIITPAIVVNTSTGTFTNGQFIKDQTTGANVEIIEADNTTLASSGYVILKVKPRDIDLANSSATSNNWTIFKNSEIRNTTNTAVGVVKGIIGHGASATLKTTAAGKVNVIDIVYKGIDYSISPNIRIRSINNSSGLSSLNLEAKNYIQKIKTSSSEDTVGNSYQFGVGPGIVYQKGHFIKVYPQNIIVSKYDNVPNNVSVVFETKENIINSNIDTSLLDNALGTVNETAPGADRLKLTANLVLSNTDIAESNAEAYILTSFSEGTPYKQNQFTAYNAINDEMAERTKDTSGNFVLDQFSVTTKSPSNSAFEGNTISIVVDPGRGYINGYRVATDANYVKNINKGIDTIVTNTFNISLGYQNYIRISDVAGLFQFNTGDQIELYDTAKNYISNSAIALAETISTVGTKLGYARIRSMTLENGVPGTSSAIYRLYLFDIDLDSGKNFKDVKSVYYNGAAVDGIADVILDLDPTTATDVANIKGRGNLLFNTTQYIKNANNVKYIYRTITSNTSLNSISGSITLSLTGTPDEFFPYTGTLNDEQLKELYVAPAQEGMIANAAITGTVAATTTSANLIGTGTSFIADLRIGDYIYVYANSVSYSKKLVTNIVNNTFITLSSNISFANATSYVKRYFPKYLSIPFGDRDGYSANVDANNNILKIDMGLAIQTPGNSNMIVGYNVRRDGSAAGTKVAQRNIYVKLAMANNEANNTGPWHLGVSDIFRLKNVYLGSNSSVNTSSTNVTEYFYVDHNQTGDYYDQGYLYVKPDINFRPNTSNWLLVDIDRFNTSTNGYYTPVSYLTANAAQIANVDSKALSVLTTQVNTLEVPEMVTDMNQYYDLLTTFDFRPAVISSANLTTNVAAATINPPSNTTLNIGSSEKKFPYPGTLLTGTIEYYVGRTDTISINKNNTITIKNGVPEKHIKPIKNRDSMTLSLLNIPSYPTIAQNPSANVQGILDKKIVSERYLFNRINNKIVKELLANNEIKDAQPRAYKMRDIGRIEQRVRNLEYAVSLSLLESQLKNKVIPSSISPDINRFKYGFFIDDFTNDNFSSTKNPEYTAYLDKRSKELYPLTELLNISLDSTQDFPYDEVIIVSQNIATEPVVIISRPPEPLGDDGTIIETDDDPPDGLGPIITDDGDDVPVDGPDHDDPVDGPGPGPDITETLIVSYVEPVITATIDIAPQPVWEGNEGWPDAVEDDEEEDDDDEDDEEGDDDDDDDGGE
mgnify:CR=1 FL=1